MPLQFPNNSSVFVQGASEGIGLAFVKNFLKDERIKKVIASSRNSQDSVLSDLILEHPKKLEIYNLDLENQSSINDCADQILKFNHELDCLLNVSGLLHSDLIKPEKRVRDLNIDNLNKIFSVNTFGPIILTSKLLPLLKGRTHSIIANISARVGSIEDNRSGGWHSYRSSKAALNMLTKNLAIELSRNKKFNTLCVALHPGTVDTELSKPFSKNTEPSNLFTPKESAENLLKVISSLSIEDSGNFFDWSGKQIPW
tara:strand:- start:1437 stop:2204 length:768 start_codon:yes stop_codon:yes gene_type:complete